IYRDHRDLHSFPTRRSSDLDIYAQYAGRPITKNIGIIYHYNDFLEKYKKLIGIEIKQVTWNKFNYILSDLKDFIQWKYKQKDFRSEEHTSELQSRENLVCRL